MRGVMEGLKSDNRQVFILTTESSGMTTSRSSFIIFFTFLKGLSVRLVSCVWIYFPSMRMKVLV
jgi:hypothetical protein